MRAGLRSSRFLNPQACPESVGKLYFCVTDWEIAHDSLVVVRDTSKLEALTGQEGFIGSAETPSCHYCWLRRMRGELY